MDGLVDGGEWRGPPDGEGLNLCAGERGDADGGGTGGKQRAGAFAGGGAGGVDVVEEKDVAAGDGDGVDDGEGVLEIGAALMRREAEVALSVAAALEGIMRGLQIPMRSQVVEFAESGAGEQDRLVESAGALAAGAGAAAGGAAGGAGGA